MLPYAHLFINDFLKGKGDEQHKKPGIRFAIRQIPPLPMMVILLL